MSKDEVYLVMNSRLQDAMTEFVKASEALDKSEEDMLSDISNAMFEAGKETWEAITTE